MQNLIWIHNLSASHSTIKGQKSELTEEMDHPHCLPLQVESTCFGDWSHPGNQRVCVNPIIGELSRSLAGYQPVGFWIWWLYWMRILKALSFFVPVMCRIPTAYNLSWVISYCAQHWSFSDRWSYRWIPLKHPCLNNVSRAWKVWWQMRSHGHLSSHAGTSMVLKHPRHNYSTIGRLHMKTTFLKRLYLGGGWLKGTLNWQSVFNEGTTLCSVFLGIFLSSMNLVFTPLIHISLATFHLKTHTNSAKRWLPPRGSPWTQVSRA